MKIVISPAKSLELDKKIPLNHYTNPAFIKEAIEINEQLRTLTKKELTELMNLSANLTELNFERNQTFEKTQTIENSRPAIFTFNGDVYDGLDAFNLTNSELKTLQSKLRILSGLYGILKPFDLIQAYRLEMGTKLHIKEAKNLYDFWGEKITDFLNKEMEPNEVLINLASNEYFKVIKKKSLKSKIISPIFKDFKNGKLKVISFYAKKARGSMVRYIIKNNVTDLNELYKFNYDNYQFSSEYTSNENEPVYIR